MPVYKYTFIYKNEIKCVLYRNIQNIHCEYYKIENILKISMFLQ